MLAFHRNEATKERLYGRRAILRLVRPKTSDQLVYTLGKSQIDDGRLGDQLHRKMQALASLGSNGLQVRLFLYRNCTGAETRIPDGPCSTSRI